MKAPPVAVGRSWYHPSWRPHVSRFITALAAVIDTSQVKRKIIVNPLWYNAMRLNYTRHILPTTDVVPSLGDFPCLANPAIMR